jgi:tetratricopeptide (TPR) repeat protein
VCQGCGLLTPRAIEELSAVLKEVRAPEVDAAGFSLSDQIRQRLLKRGVLSEDVDALFAHLPRDAEDGLGTLVQRIVTIPPDKVAAARPRVRRQPPAAASAAPAPVPATGSTAARDHWSAAVKLKGHEFRYALGSTILVLVVVTLMRAINVDEPLLFIILPVMCIAWCAFTALQWYHLRRTDPDVLWQQDVGTVEESTVQRPEPAAATRTATTISVRWTPDDLRRAQAGTPWNVGDVLFGWYAIDAIRTGGFGIVYLCRHTETGEGQAIKTVLLNPLAAPHIRESMINEARLWAALPSHSNIVACDFVQTGVLDKRLWIGMERVEGDPLRGVTLRDWLQRGPIAHDDAIRFIGGICEAMHHVAASRLVHGDLKPANILITGTGFAKVADFGLARPVYEMAEGGVLTLAGTPGYMSPESWIATTSTASSRDVYAFGVIVWEILTSRHPFAGHAQDIRLAHVVTPPADPRTVNPSADPLLSQIAIECLSKVSETRPSFAALLQRLQDAFPTAQWSDRRTRPSIGIECNRISALITLGNLPEAERCLDALLARDDAGGHVLIHAQRVQLFKALGRLPDAHDSLRRLAEMDAVTVGTLLMKSDANRDLGQHETALACLDQALALAPEDGWALYRKGVCLQALGRYVESESVLRRASELATESGIAALVALATSHRSHGRESIAQEHLIEALTRNPNDERTLCDMARLLATLGRRDVALQCIDRALTLNADNLEAHYFKATLLRAGGHVDAATTVLRTLADRTPPHLMACAELAVALSTSAPEDSRHYFSRIEQAACLTASDYFCKAAVLATIFELWRPALECIDHAVNRAPTSAMVWSFKAELHSYLDELDAATTSYRRAKTHAPQDPDIDRKSRALASFIEGQRLLESEPAQALDAYRRAADEHPANFRYLFAKAVALRQLGRHGQALASLEEGLQHAPRSAAPFLRMIRIECLTALHLVADAQAAALELLPLVKDEAGRTFVQQIMSSERPAITREQIASHWQKKGTEAQIADRLEEAIEMHSRAVYITPAHGARKGGLASCLVIQGCKTSNASMQASGLRTFQEALTFGRDPTTLFNYAQALRMAGRPSDALPVVQEVLTITPDDPEAETVLRELRAPTVH